MKSNVVIYIYNLLNEPNLIYTLSSLGNKVRKKSWERILTNTIIFRVLSYPPLLSFIVLIFRMHVIFLNNNKNKNSHFSNCSFFNGASLVAQLVKTQPTTFGAWTPANMMCVERLVNFPWGAEEHGGLESE